MGRTNRATDRGTPIYREFAEKAYSDLGSSVPEFGKYTATAIYDTAADALTTVIGSDFDHAELRTICAQLAGVQADDPGRRTGAAGDIERPATRPDHRNADPDNFQADSPDEEEDGSMYEGSELQTRDRLGIRREPIDDDECNANDCGLPFGHDDDDDDPEPAVDLDEVRTFLDEAQIHLEDAVDALQKAESASRRVGGPYWLHGQLEAYTIPTIRTFAGDERYQPGCIGGLIRSLEADEDEE